MKKSFAAMALVAAAAAAPAFAGDVGISISVGEPGFYGQIELGNMGRPPVIYSQPVIVERRYRDLAPVYLRVPPDQARNWRRYCGRYDACYRPVYFVRDDWYQRVYVPRYQEAHRGPGWRDERRDGRHDDRRDDRRDDHRGDRRDDRGRGPGPGPGPGPDRDRGHD